jgi:hypothetical protein
MSEHGVSIQDADYDHVNEGVAGLGYTEAEINRAIMAAGHPGGGVDFDLSDTGRANVIAALRRDKEPSLAETAGELAGIGLETSLAQIAAQAEAAREQFQYNLDQAPKVVKTARDIAEHNASALNVFMRNENEAMFDRIMPGWRDQFVGAATDAQQGSIDITNQFRKNVLPGLLKAAESMGMQALEDVQAQLRGELPPDVEQRLRRQSTHLANQLNLRSQAGEFLTARDFGATTMDLKQRGLQNAPAAMALTSQGFEIANQTLQAPVSTGINALGLIRNFLPPQADAAAMTGNLVANLFSQASPSANAILQTTAQTFDNNAARTQSLYGFTTQQSDASYWNQINYGAQMQALELEKKNSKFGWGDALAIGGTVAGAALGGPMGAALVGGAATTKKS